MRMRFPGWLEIPRDQVNSNGRRIWVHSATGMWLHRLDHGYKTLHSWHLRQAGPQGIIAGGRTLKAVIADYVTQRLGIGDEF